MNEVCPVISVNVVGVRESSYSGVKVNESQQYDEGASTLLVRHMQI